MMIPCEIGLSPIGDLTYAERAKELLVRLQGQGGYASDDDSNRVKELLAIAYALGLTYAILEVAADGVFPARAVELLEDHERWMRIPNDAPRTIRERQIRASAVAAGAAGGGAAALEASLARLGITPTLHRATRAETLSDGVEADGLLQTLVEITEADWADPGKRRGAIDLLRRILPVVQYGQLGRPSPAACLVTSTDAKWARPNHNLGRTSLSPGAAFAQDRVPSRWRSYARTSRLDAADLMALQEQTLLAPANGAGSTLVGGVSGHRRYAFAVEIPTGTTVEILSGLNALGRLARIVIRHSDIDIRPGETADTDVGESDLYQHLWFTGTGGASYQVGTSGVGNILASATGVTIEATEIIDRYAVGWIELSDVVTSGDTDQVLATFEDGDDLTAMSAAWLLSLVDASATRRANGADVDAWLGWTQYGGLARACVLAHSVRPGSGTKTYVIDASVDWRDRVLLVQHSTHASTFADGGYFPGCPFDHVYSANLLGSTLHYTRDGSAECELGGGLRIYARSDDGALCLDHYDSFVGDPHVASLLLIRATDQLGKRSEATPLAVPTAPADDAAIEPSQLNWVQDFAMVTQGRGRPAYWREGDGDPVLLAANATPGHEEIRPVSISDFPEVGPYPVRLNDGVGGTELVTATGTSTTPYDRIVLDPLTPVVGTYNAGPSSVALADTGTEQAEIPCDSMPLGPVVTGSPSIPRAWRVRRRDAHARRERVERRQDVAGSLRRLFACEIDDAESLLIDDSQDWRDRIIHGFVAYAATDIRPGGAAELDLNSSTQSFVTAYTGPGWSGSGTFLYYLPIVTNALGLYARASDGALMARNAIGGTRYLAGWVETSFPLGPRGARSV